MATFLTILALDLGHPRNTHAPVLSAGRPIDLLVSSEIMANPEKRAELGASMGASIKEKKAKKRNAVAPAAALAGQRLNLLSNTMPDQSMPLPPGWRYVLSLYCLSLRTLTLGAATSQRTNSRAHG